MYNRYVTFLNAQIFYAQVQDSGERLSSRMKLSPLNNLQAQALAMPRAERKAK